MAHYLAGRGRAWREWQSHRQHLVLQIARRDSGRWVLVVVNVRHCHHLRQILQKYPEVQVVPYSEL